MDLEGFARRRIVEGAGREEIITELKSIVGEYKDWEEEKNEVFSAALFDEVETSQAYRDLNDGFLKEILETPECRVRMGEFGVGSRGAGDFRVHRDIAEIIGEGGVVIGPGEQDDAGVVEAGGRYVTVAVDGIHSRLSGFPFLAGFHAARAALRDVLSMGSKPVALIDDLHLADDGDVGKLYDFVAGVSAVADLTGTPLAAGSTLRIGGDMVFGDRLVAAVGAVGVSDSIPLARRYAEAGDVILLTMGKGGGTIATTAIYSGNFNVVRETLNVDFMSCVNEVFQADFLSDIHTMTDITNGGLRGDAHEISKTSGTRLVFYAEEVNKTVSRPVLDMLNSLGIDFLGVSTDSLMIILPKEKAGAVRHALEGVSPVYEVGYVEKGGGAVMIGEDGGEEHLTPLFRESAYTPVKKVVGETPPDDLKRMAQALDDAKQKALKKKEAVKEWVERK